MKLKNRMGTTWRNFGSATRTKTRMDSSTWRSLASSVPICCGVTAERMACTSDAGRRGGATRGLAGDGIGKERRRMGGRRSRACFSLETRRNFSSAVL